MGLVADARKLPFAYGDSGELEQAVASADYGRARDICEQQARAHEASGNQIMAAHFWAFHNDLIGGSE